jgi:CTP:molybdopterin cytidylyltransferase MocA
MGEQNKALLKLGQESFLARIASSCAEAGVEEVVVVIAAPHAEETQKAAEGLGLGCAHNLEPERGMGSSVAVGFDYALQNFESEFCWLWPVDVPRASASTLSALSVQRESGKVLIPCVGDRGGHPVLVARSLWPELAQCADAPEGARSVFRRDPSRVLRVPVSDPYVCRDVDHPDDLKELAKEMHS